MIRDCISDNELKKLIKNLKQKNINYVVYKNEEKMLFIRGHQVKYIVDYDSDFEFK